MESRSNKRLKVSGSTMRLPEAVSAPSGPGTDATSTAPQTVAGPSDLGTLATNQPIAGQSRAKNVAGASGSGATTNVRQTPGSTNERRTLSMMYSTPAEFHIPFPSIEMITSDPTAAFTSSQFQWTSFAQLAASYREMTTVTGAHDASVSRNDPPPPVPPQVGPRFSRNNLPTNLDEWVEYTDWFCSALLTERNTSDPNDSGYNSYLDCLIQCAGLLRLLISLGRNN